jgi:DNA primase
MTGIATALDKLGIEYSIRGSEAVACCPAHDDHHPSWSINLTSGMHYCFSCGFKGGLTGLVAQVSGVPYRDARLWALRQNVRCRQEAPRFTETAGDYSWKYTEASLFSYSSPPPSALAAKHLSAASCDVYGILWDTEKDAWIFPIRDPWTGELWGWQEKSDQLFRNRPRAVAKSRSLFGLRTLEHGCRPVLVESPVDTARLHTAGIRGGVSSFGVSVSSHQLAPLLRRDGELVLALDNDAAGFRETRRLAGRAGTGRRFLIFNYGDSPAKDPGEMTGKEIIWGMENLLTWRQWLALHPY